MNQMLHKRIDTLTLKQRCSKMQLNKQYTEASSSMREALHCHVGYGVFDATRMFLLPQ